MGKHDIIVIGAGISGLSLAHCCAKSGLDVLVLEKSDRTGGCFHSHRFGGDASDFWLELGAHTCYNSYRNLLGIIEDCRMLDHIAKREKVPFRLLVDNEVKSIPSRIDFTELVLSAPRLLTLKKAGQSVGSYYPEIVGRRNFDKLFTYVFDAVISQEAKDFPADMLFKKRERRKDIIKKFTLSGGLQSVTDSIASQAGIRVLTGEEVRAIEFSEGVFNVKTRGGGGHNAPGLAVAAPANVAAQLLQNAFPEISEQLAKIKVNVVETMGVAVRKEAVSIKPVAGIIAINDVFYSAVSRDVVPHDGYRGFSFHFKSGVLDHEEKLSRIGRVLGVGTKELESVAKINIVPGLRVGHDKRVGEIDRLISGRQLLLTGNYFSGMAIEDCVSRSLKEYSRLKF